jgi:hypothetical protein
MKTPSLQPTSRLLLAILAFALLNSVAQQAYPSLITSETLSGLCDNSPIGDEPVKFRADGPQGAVRIAESAVTAPESGVIVGLAAVGFISWVGSKVSSFRSKKYLSLFEAR